MPAVVAVAELFPTTTPHWGRDVTAVYRKELTFPELYRRHNAYVALLVRKLQAKYRLLGRVPRVDLHQEVWAIVAEALRKYDPNHPKKAPVAGFVGYLINKRVLRLLDVVKRIDPPSLLPRYMDYLLIEERVVAMGAARLDGMVTLQPRLVGVAQPNCEVEHDAEILKLVAVAAGTTARASSLIAMVVNGSTVDEAARRLYPKLKRPNKAGHRALAQARAAVERVANDQTTIEQPLANPIADNDDYDIIEQTKLRPIRKVRGPKAGQDA